jgi:hypothetical protein
LLSIVANARKRVPTLELLIERPHVRFNTEPTPEGWLSTELTLATLPVTKKLLWGMSNRTGRPSVLSHFKHDGGRKHTSAPSFARATALRR